jgi:hypothetical protein
VELTRLSDACSNGDCPAVYVTERGTLVLQGATVHAADGLRLGVGEQAVELPVDLVRTALAALAEEAR